MVCGKCGLDIASNDAIYRIVVYKLSNYAGSHEDLKGLGKSPVDICRSCFLKMRVEFDGKSS